MARETTDQLKKDLRKKPDDEGLRIQLARALELEGQVKEAVEVLLARFVNLTAHDDPTLPCLCRHCLEPERITAEVQGMSFRRDFSVTKGRVLFYWIPEGMKQRRAVQNAVANRMRIRLKPKRQH